MAAPFYQASKKEKTAKNTILAKRLNFQPRKEKTEAKATIFSQAYARKTRHDFSSSFSINRLLFPGFRHRKYEQIFCQNKLLFHKVGNDIKKK